MKISLGSENEFRNIVNSLVIESNNTKYKIIENENGLSISALKGILISQASYQNETIKLKIINQNHYKENCNYLLIFYLLNKIQLQHHIQSKRNAWF